MFLLKSVDILVKSFFIIENYIDFGGHAVIFSYLIQIGSTVMAYRENGIALLAIL